MAYPRTRAAYADLVSEVPIDSGPLITKRAAATHVNDDFILFRTREYHELIRRDLPFATGPIFGWSRQLYWAPPDLGQASNEIANGSFERWEPGGAPAGFEVRLHGSGARVEENRDRAWVRDGDASVRAVLPARGVAELVYIHPQVAALRGRFLELSACLASPGRRPIGVSVTVLQPDGYNILTPHTYRGGGGWECFRRGFLVGEGATGLELTLALSDLAEAEVYVDRLDLRAFPAAEPSPPSPVITRWLESRDPNRVVLRVDAPEDGYLIRKENYHGGWSALIDGRPAIIERYAGAFQALALARGPHTVEFTFRSAYPLLMWMHVAAVLVGYLGLYGYLLKRVAVGGLEERA